MVPFWPLFTFYFVLLRNLVLNLEDFQNFEVFVLGSRGFGTRVIYPILGIGGNDYDLL